MGPRSAFAILLVHHVFHWVSRSDSGFKQVTANYVTGKETKASSTNFLSLEYRETTCEVKKHYRSKFYGNPPAVIDPWVQSDDMCLSLCWQFKAAGYPCRSINFDLLRKKCELLDQSYDDGKHGVMAHDTISIYKMPLNCTPLSHSYNRNTVVKYAPMKCKSKTYPGKIFYGAVALTTEWANSEDVCVSLCWQYNNQGHKCLAVNYIRWPKKCELLKEAYRWYADKLRDHRYSSYIVTSKCSLPK